MVIATSPSKVSLPQHNPGVTTVLEYLSLRFPRIPREVWQQRMSEGKVHWHDGSLISSTTPFAAQSRVYYYREVTKEPSVPFTEEIIFQDDSILIAHKPHFLPVTPGGEYVEECLQSRLRRKLGNENLQALHRIDRATAGLVMFSLCLESRQHYHRLFEARQIRKTYQAIAKFTGTAPSVGQQWEVKNRLQKSGTRFLMEVVDGAVNSHSTIRCLQISRQTGLFELSPITGKTHQLRLHMQQLGWPILNDDYYPHTRLKHGSDDYSAPLQLLAQKLEFQDPITKKARVFSSNAELCLD